MQGIWMYRERKISINKVFTLTAIFRIMALAAILAFIDWHSTIFVFLPLIIGDI